MSDILFILGNGPSLSNIMNNDKYLEYVKQHDTFCLNSFYKMMKKYDFTPTYYGCFDYIVNESMKKDFSKLVLEENGIKELYFIGNQRMGQLSYSEEVLNNDKFVKFNFKDQGMDGFKEISKSFDSFANTGSSGANALQIGIMKGYKKIILLGCDCNYIEKVDGANVNSSGQLVIKDNVKENPNYWFPEYHSNGDTYNFPKTQIYQIGSWKNIYNHCPKDVEILNCSEISQIPYFKKININICIENEYKKQVLILLCGLPRTFKQCSQNIMQTLITCNSKYNFTIIVSTDKTFANKEKWCNKTDEKKYDNIEELENDLHKCYTTTNCNIKKILYSSLHEAPGSIFQVRLKSILEYCDLNKLNFDKYIFIRPDIVLNKQINLDVYNNVFHLVPGPGNLTIPSSRNWMGADWDYMWIGCKESFMLWVYPYILEPRWEITNVVDNVYTKLWKKQIPLSDDEAYKINQSHNFLGVTNHSLYEYYARIIKFLIMLKIKFTNSNDIVASVIR